MNALLEKHTKDIEDILKKYPEDQKRSAVMPLLYVAMRENGFVSKQDMYDIAEIIKVSATQVASIVGFYTLYHDKEGGKHRVQVCNDLPCALRGSGEYLEKLCENIGIKVGETTEDGLVSVESVMCLAGCDKAPMFQEQNPDGVFYHEDQTVESTLELIEQWRKQEAK
ncbi:MAG: NAD(P)H-dependent oxidoreductase subunit E [Chloroflexi bacterium]|nr:NAD(P)H-dependent oxidoreductase subunit E [Chloroflexota bacterium]MBT3669186.1 NAD(P)H-dependent oxidoreductase subunit E [Chloroflexota bacterium]MBT4002722.1 NAD(P)H-dependent oxidoreductase subunit E [Chloroflexota bacterium]MBT4306431.1 NAD(P)H-dependent oxidoreductase subunit E [Chloroflexota bacterium]MBT4534930.1 NAD(P)H-dependent oxidoreductase subunit E [Chloroflexota bacterium]